MNEKAQKGLRFEAGMAGDAPFLLWGFSAMNNIQERTARRQPAESAGLEALQTFTNGHSGGQRFAEQAPRLVTATRHGTHVWEFVFRALGPVAAPECSNQTNYLAAKFEAAGNERGEDELGKEGIACEQDVGAGAEHWEKGLSPFDKKIFKALALFSIESGEPGQRRAGVPVKR